MPLVSWEIYKGTPPPAFGGSAPSSPLPQKERAQTSGRARVPVPPTAHRPSPSCSLRSGSCGRTWHSRTWTWRRSARRRFRPRTCSASRAAATRWWRPARGPRRRRPRALWRSCSPRKVSPPAPPQPRRGELPPSPRALCTATASGSWSTSPDGSVSRCRPTILVVAGGTLVNCSPGLPFSASETAFSQASLTRFRHDLSGL